MKEKKIEIKAIVQETKELSVSDARLRSIAIEAAKRAYAPYSHFSVGAAALLQNGTVVEGSNQENVAYPSGLCAERVALFSAGASFPNEKVEALAIAAIKDGDVVPFVSPCGACRQVLLETEQRSKQDVRVMMCGKDETLIVSSAKDLLPFGFEKF